MKYVSRMRGEQVGKCDKILFGPWEPIRLQSLSRNYACWFEVVDIGSTICMLALSLGARQGCDKEVTP